MIQIFKSKFSIEPEDDDDFFFLYNGKKLDINSQMKIEELFNNNFVPKIIFIFNSFSKITFNSSSGISTRVKCYGCVCCSNFWDLLEKYLREIDLNENCLKDLKFICTEKLLPNDKNEAIKSSCGKYGINGDSTIFVIDEKNLIKEKKKGK